MKPTPDRPDRSEFAGALRKGFLAGAAALVVLLPVAFHEGSPLRRSLPTVSAPKPVPPAHHLASFGEQPPSPDVRQVANWVTDSRDNGTRAFVIVDKKASQVWAFDPAGRVLASAPAVMGSAHGDDTYPGVADKPLSALKPEEKTTPAGRFIAEPGESSSRGEDVVWVDYDAAVSMHRVIPAKERLAALATPGPEDNRLSNGCINVPVAFYEQVLRPTVDRQGVVFYVLPETRGLRDTFASFYDPEAAPKVAQR